VRGSLAFESFADSIHAVTIAAMLAHVIPISLAANLSWPDGIDGAVTAAYLSFAFGLAALGYLCMVLDFRAYLRSLRRALVVISNYRSELPNWVRRDTPRCILALELTLPCTSDDILAAYRRKVKQLHPDRGGDRRDFLRLQAHFEQAMSLMTEK
jgi:hypothetical protein